MRREIYTIESNILQRDVKVYVYGHYGISVLLFPFIGDNPSEYEDIGLIQTLSQLIEKGHIKIFSVETNNKDSWLNNTIPHEQRSENHYKFNQFITNELTQFIYNDNGCAVPIITSGGGIGAFHAVNSYLRRPDIFMGSIGTNGFYDIQWLSGSYYDENCYFNSPVHYLPNLTDDYWLSFLKSQRYLHLLAQENNQEMIKQAENLAAILRSKGVPFQMDIINADAKDPKEIFRIMLENSFRSKF